MTRLTGDMVSRAMFNAAKRMGHIPESRTYDAEMAVMGAEERMRVGAQTAILVEELNKVLPS